MHTIRIVMLPAPAALTLAQQKTLTSGLPVYVQTKLHPSADYLRELQIDSLSMDDLFESSEDFDSLNSAIADRLCSTGDCVYVATGNIQNSQLPAIEREAAARGVRVAVLPYLTAGQVAFPEREQAVAVSAHDLPEQIDPEQNYVVEEIDSRIVAGDAKLFISEFCPDESAVILASIGKDARQTAAPGIGSRRMSR